MEVEVDVTKSVIHGNVVINVIESVMFESIIKVAVCINGARIKHGD